MWLLIQGARSSPGHCNRQRDTYCQVVSEELHDESAVFVRLLVQLVKLCNGVIERLPTGQKQNPWCSQQQQQIQPQIYTVTPDQHSAVISRSASNVQYWDPCPTEPETSPAVWGLADLFGQWAGLLRRVEDLVVEHGEVEGQAQADGVCGIHLLLADVKRLLVSLLRVVDGC